MHARLVLKLKGTAREKREEGFGVEHGEPTSEFFLEKSNLEPLILVYI